MPTSIDSERSTTPVKLLHRNQLPPDPISNRATNFDLVAVVTPGRSTLQVEVRRSDVQSAWSGLRPLAMDPNAADTASASRDHIVTQDPDGLITVTGGAHDLRESDPFVRQGPAACNFPPASALSMASSAISL